MRNRQSFSFFSSNKNNTKAVSLPTTIHYGSLNVLPEELIREILSYLPATDLQRFARVTEQIYKRWSVEKLFKLKHMNDLNDWSLEAGTLQNFNEKFARKRHDLQSAIDKFERSLRKENKRLNISEAVDNLECNKIVSVGSFLLYAGYIIVMAMLAARLSEDYRYLGTTDFDKALLSTVLPLCFFVGAAIHPPIVIMTLSVGIQLYLQHNKLSRDLLRGERNAVARQDMLLKSTIEDYRHYHLPSHRGGM